ncbi:hypothetical protein FA95DRAFT_1607417 [Auriscalpium vulgare]|uniref:Uncharacterized protein n=1 Tax=Auriscalpium vulgare TaxID=40419 RepID=A0ACB8RQJ0_9AGAM|nr:hypothetical protein FA95DRAFT_1607417 [Auriscalpium vulgare]
MVRADLSQPLSMHRLGDDPNIDEDGCESADVDFIAQYDAPYDALATVPPPPITIQPAPLPSLPVPLPAMHTVAPATVPPTAIQPAPPPSRPVPATRTVPHTTKALTVVHYNAQRNGENDRDTGVNRVAQQKENGAQADQTLQLWYWPSDDAPKPLPCRVACKQWPHFKLTHSWDFISAAFRLPGPRPLAIEMFHPVDQQWIVQELDIIEDVSKIGKVLLYRAPGVSEREDMLSKQADVIQGLPSRAKHPRTKPITSLSLGKPLPLPFLPIPAPQWSTESPPVTPSRPRKRQRSVSDGSPGSPLTKRQRDLSPVPIDEEPFDDIFEIPAPSPPPELLATKPSQRVTKPLRRQVTKPQTQRSLRQGTLPPIVDVDETVARTHKGAAWPFKDFALMAAGFQIMDELPKGCLPADMFALSFPSVAHLYKRATFYKHKGFWTKGLALGIQDEFVDRGPELLWGDFIATVAVALKRSKEQGEPSADSAIQDELMSADSGMDFGAQKESVVAASVTADSSTPLNLEPAASPNVTESMILPDEGLGELGWADDLIINPSLLLPDDLEHRIRALEAEITELWLDPCDNEFYQNYQQGDSSLQNFVLHFGAPRIKATAHLLDSICPEKVSIDVDRADFIHHVIALEVTTLMLMQDIRLSRDEALAFIGVQSSDTVMATEDDGIHIKVEELDDTRPLPGGLEGMVGVSVVEENGIEIIVID